MSVKVKRARTGGRKRRGGDPRGRRGEEHLSMWWELGSAESTDGYPRVLLFCRAQIRTASGGDNAGSFREKCSV